MHVKWMTVCIDNLMSWGLDVWEVIGNRHSASDLTAGGQLTHLFTDSCDGFPEQNGGMRVPDIQAGLRDWKRRKKQSLNVNPPDAEQLIALVHCWISSTQQPSPCWWVSCILAKGTPGSTHCVLNYLCQQKLCQWSSPAP